MRRSFARASLALGLVVPLVACGALLDLQTLDFVETATDGAAEGATSDAQGDANDGAPNDGGGVDAHNPCSDGKKHDFCDDFEGITGNVEDRWNKRLEVTGTGRISAEMVDGAPSPVTVFRSTMDRAADGGTGVHAARITKMDSPWARTDGGAQPSVRFVVEVLLETIDVPPYDVVLLDVMIGLSPSVSPDFEDSLGIYASNDGAEHATLQLWETYKDAAGMVQYSVKPVDAKIPIGVWTTVELVVQERAPGSNGGTVLIVGGAPQSYPLASGSRIPYFRADLGLAKGSFSGSRSTALYDNVRIDYLP